MDSSHLNPSAALASETTGQSAPIAQQTPIAEIKSLAQQQPAQAVPQTQQAQASSGSNLSHGVSSPSPATGPRVISEEEALAHLSELQQQAASNFAAALAADQQAALQPRITEPFASAEDVVRRLLPYHVFQIPIEDLEYAIEQHRVAHVNRTLRRKKRPRLEPPPPPLAEPSSAKVQSSAAVEPDASAVAETSASGAASAAKDEAAKVAPQASGDVVMADATADASKASSSVSRSPRISRAGSSPTKAAVAAAAPAQAASAAEASTSAEPPKKKTRLRIKLPSAASRAADAAESGRTPGDQEKSSAKSVKNEHAKPQTPREPEPYIPWWDADPLLLKGQPMQGPGPLGDVTGDAEDVFFPTTMQAIDLFERHASITERIKKLLVRADGGHLHAQGQVFMETQFDRHAWELDRELYAEVQADLGVARNQWDAFLKEHPLEAKAIAMAATPAKPAPSHAPPPASIRAPAAAGSPAGSPPPLAAASLSTAKAGSPAQPQTPAMQPVGPRPGIPQQPIVLQIPLPILPRLTALGMNAMPAPHLVPLLRDKKGAASTSAAAAGAASTSAGTATLDPSAYLRSIGPESRPQPPPPNQEQPALLTGITQAQAQPTSPGGAPMPALHVLHISVRLDKLLPHQLSGLAQIMTSLQAQTQQTQQQATTPVG